MKKKKIRVDSLLITRGLAESLPQAKALIMSGVVLVDDQRIDDASACFGEEVELRLKGTLSRFVGRGGEKLEAALSDFGLSAKILGSQCLDIGASTGGFTQCLLLHGAKQVIALDVGYNQLDWRLRQDPRVVVREQTDIRVFAAKDHPPLDWVVADMSFVSLAQLASDIAGVAGPDTQLLLLVKPQFELERSAIPDGGVVIEEADIARAVVQVEKAFACFEWKKLGSALARPKGRSGNQEVFLWLSK